MSRLESDFCPAAIRRHQVSLQRLTRSVDTNGDRGESWATYATAWARISTPSATSAADRETAGTFGNSAKRMVEIPYDARVTAKDRIRYGSRTLLISGINNMNERNRMLQLSCWEET